MGHARLGSAALFALSLAVSGFGPCSGNSQQSGGSGGSNGPPPPATPVVGGTWIDDIVDPDSASGSARKPRSTLMDAIELTTYPVTHTFTRVAGKGASDGTFSVPNPPQGPYLLHYNHSGPVEFTPNPFYVGPATGSFEFDVGPRLSGRDDLVTSDPFTQLTFHLKNTLQWSDGMSLEAGSWGADAFFIALDRAVDPPPKVGSTTLDAVLPDYGLESFGRAGLIDGTKGDVAFVTQLVPRSTASGLKYVTVGRAARFPSFTMQQKGNTSITADLTDATTQPLQFNFLRSQFVQQGGPSPRFSFFFAGVEPIGVFPGLPDNLDTATLPDLLDVIAPAGSGDVSDTVSMGVPSFWSGNPMLVQAGVLYPYSFSAPGASRAATAYGGVQVYVPLTSPISVAPTVGPVTAPQIGGADASYSQTVLPVPAGALSVSWGAPALGTYPAYRVELESLGNVNGSTRLDRGPVVVTTSTSFDLPTSDFAPGLYVLRITSMSPAGAASPLKTPFVVAPPIGTASVFTRPIEIRK